MKTYKVLRRNHTTQSVLRELPDDARAARIQEAVDAVLGTLVIENEKE